MSERGSLTQSRRCCLKILAANHTKTKNKTSESFIFLRAGCRTRARTRHTTALAKSRRLDTSLGTAARASKRAERE